MSDFRSLALKLPQPTEDGDRTCSDQLFAQASFSLNALETIEYPARPPLAEQHAAQVFVRTHWKNFHLNFCALQVAEKTPYRKSLYLLHRADRLMRYQVPFELHTHFEAAAETAREKHRKQNVPLPLRSKVPSFYLAMLRKEVLGTKL